MDENSDLVVQERGFLLVLDSADVHLFEIAHDHHLPLVFVFRDSPIGGAPKSVLVQILVIFLWLCLDQQFSTIISLPDQLQQLASSFFENVISRLVEDLRPKYGRPMLRVFLIKDLLLVLWEELETLRNFPFSAEGVVLLEAPVLLSLECSWDFFFVEIILLSFIGAESASAIQLLI